MGGMITSLLLRRYSGLEWRQQFYTLLLFLSILSLTAGFILHKYFIISKISGTSTWVMFSLSSAFFLFAFLHWIVDHLGKGNWFRIIKTAGTATLTCYLIPYIYYSFRSILQIQLDGFIVHGIAGLTKSLAFAFIIIGITWILGRLKIRLNI